MVEFREASRAAGGMVPHRDAARRPFPGVAAHLSFTLDVICPRPRARRAARSARARSGAESRDALAETAGVAVGATRPTRSWRSRSRTGYWCGDLLGDTTLESDYVLLQLWLHPPERRSSGGRPPWDRIDKARRRHPRRGSWRTAAFNIYPEGPAEINATVKAYAALKLAGLSPDERAHAARARVRAAPGRHPGDEQLRPHQPEPVRPLPAPARADHSPSSSCCCPAASSTRCRRGRAPSWCRCRSCRRARAAVPCPPGFDLDELAVPGKSFQFPRRDRLSAVFTPARRRAQGLGEPRSRDDPRDPRCARPRSGCSIAPATATGSGRSIPR